MSDLLWLFRMWRRWQTLSCFVCSAIELLLILLCFLFFLSIFKWFFVVIINNTDLLNRLIGSLRHTCCYTKCLWWDTCLFLIFLLICFLLLIWLWQDRLMGLWSRSNDCWTIALVVIIILVAILTIVCIIIVWKSRWFFVLFLILFWNCSTCDTVTFCWARIMIQRVMPLAQLLLLMLDILKLWVTHHFIVWFFQSI